MELTLQLTDDYTARNQMLGRLQLEAHNWFELALGRAPVELHATLQVGPLFLSPRVYLSSSILFQEILEYKSNPISSRSL